MMKLLPCLIAFALATISTFFAVEWMGSNLHFFEETLPGLKLRKAAAAGLVFTMVYFFIVLIFALCR